MPVQIIFVFELRLVKLCFQRIEDIFTDVLNKLLFYLLTYLLT